MTDNQVRILEGNTFVVSDGRYVSARWPGDAYRFARTFASLL